MNRSFHRSDFLSLAAAAALTAGLASPAAADTFPVRVQGNLNDDSIAFYYSQKSGLFQKAGLDVTIERGTSGAGVAAAVLAGSYEVGKSSITSILEAHEKGIPFTLIAPAGIQDVSAPYGGMLALKETALKSGKDLENQTVGLSSLSSIGRAAVCSWVEKNGGNWKAVQFVEIPLTQAAGAVTQKRVIASETVQPFLAQALDSGTFQALPVYDTLAPRFALTVWFTTRDWSAQHPDQAKAFAKTIAQAAAYTNAHQAETAPLLAQATSVELGVIQHMQRVTNGAALVPGQLQPIINAATRYGLLKASFPATEVIDRNAVTG